MQNVAVRAETLDGKLTRDEIFVDLAQRVAALTAAGRTPGLATVLVGDDPGSHAYVRGKHSDCAKVGITSIRRDLPADADQAQLDETIDELNANPACTGYIVQLPLPRHLDENAALERIDPAKDADGLHPTNLGRLVLGIPAPLPCTPRGIVELLRRYDVPLKGAEVVVVGRGVTVGRPLGLLLTRKTENATVTLCHTGTRDVAAHTREADIVVAAAGVAHLITADMVKPGAAVLDVGISRRTRPPLRRCRLRPRAGSARPRRLHHAGARRRRADDDHDAACQHAAGGGGWAMRNPLLGDAERIDWAAIRPEHVSAALDIVLADAEAALDDFVAHRLPHFGTYQDAIWTGEPWLYHSRLSQALNMKLLDPRDVVAAAERAWRRGKVPIESAEGFIRQVIGWREYVHIERLMVLGNIMLLCEIHPDAVYQWFMELFVDAYDWVMVPNVYGMSQHADGGLITTKPYISGSAYVLKMSNFKRGPWCEVWDGLYWRFISKHREFFARNPRMSMMAKQCDRMGAKLEQHQKVAERFLGRLS